MTRITDLADATATDDTEYLELSQVSATVQISASTISAAASDNSYNDSGNGFVTAGFSLGDRVRITGFTGNAVNNIVAATITAVTAGKLTIGGTDGDVIVDEAAGDTVLIAKWDSRKTLLGSVSGGGGSVEVKDDDTQVVAAADILDFAGAGVTVTNPTGNKALITIPGGGGGVKLASFDLASTTLATGNLAEVDVTGYTEVVVAVSASSVASGTSIDMRFSTDGGTTFRSTSGDYIRYILSDTSDELGTGYTSILTAGGGGGTTKRHCNLRVTGLNDASVPVHAAGPVGSSADFYFMSYETGFLGAVNRLRFFNADGTASTSGTLTVWGIS